MSKHRSVSESLSREFMQYRNQCCCPSNILKRNEWPMEIPSLTCGISFRKRTSPGCLVMFQLRWSCRFASHPVSLVTGRFMVIHGCFKQHGQQRKSVWYIIGQVHSSLKSTWLERRLLLRIHFGKIPPGTRLSHLASCHVVWKATQPLGTPQSRRPTKKAILQKMRYPKMDGL